MNIILLSGGSGKRLWPLSNDIRSKQFIKLLKDDQGEYESMIHRVYRQITTVAPNASVTIATSKTQVSAIRNQLGNKVSICIEPCRRDTFPAIVLAAAYLHDELDVGLDEAVVICPVDPYVDNSYYEAIFKLERIVKADTACLTLMGIEPTVPSKKYGYIIPARNAEVSPVRAFKEKPDRETAKRYIEQGAIWNAGVFACRLRYLIDKAHGIVEFTDYRDLYSKYESLERISFDYAVVEKEPSIQVVRYVGEWKDIGSWNMMSEVMADTTKGKVTLDDTCENVHAVNELDIPILAMGCKNLIIAASGDGILVTDKERSGAMKPYVEAIDNEIHFAEKSWGTYTVMDIQPSSMTVKIVLQAGKRMKYHSHQMRNEVWTVVSGVGRSIVDGMEQVVKSGDVVAISAGCKHTLIADTNLNVIEIQIGEEISYKDKKVYDLMNDIK